MPKNLDLTSRMAAYNDFRLYFMGEISRSDLASRFTVSSAGATHDLVLCRQIAPQDIEFDGRSKIYRIGKAFSPIFEHATQRVLSTLALGFGDGVNGDSQPLLAAWATITSPRISGQEGKPYGRASSHWYRNSVL